MTTNTAASSTDVKEWRRLRAWEFHLAVRRLWRKPEIIRACFRQCGFAV